MRGWMMGWRKGILCRQVCLCSFFESVQSHDGVRGFEWKSGEVQLSLYREIHEAMQVKSVVYMQITSMLSMVPGSYRGLYLVS